MIHTGDCVTVMAGMEPESVDAIVTDPPYGLEFMGKEWDRLDGTMSQPGFGARPTDWPAFGDDFAGYNPTCATCGGRARGARKCECSEPDWRVKGQRNDATARYRLMQDWHTAWATAALRVAKPGAYLLAFGGTRTVHRLTVALEDAGWIIRDLLCWVYASGFPKSKSSLKPAWEPIVMARKPGPLRELAIDACRIPGPVPAPTRGAPGSAFSDDGYVWRDKMQSEPHEAGRWPANVILTDPVFDGGIEGVVGGGVAPSAGMYREPDEPKDRGQRGGTYDPRMPFAALADDRRDNRYAGDTGTYSRFFMLPQSGTMCPCCERAKSAEPSSSPDVPRAGSAPSPVPTGASSEPTTRTDSRTTNGTAPISWLDASGSTSRTTPLPASQPDAPSPSSHASPAAPSATSSDTTTTTHDHSTCASCAEAAMRSSMDEPGFAEQPDAPRWFLIPKASRSDREPLVPGELEAIVTKPYQGNLNNAEYEYSDGAHRDAARRPARTNTHPTVKPVELMRHLVRLVTPQGGTVLDPFLGSGSTAIAAEQEGFAWLGIEREAEYVAIAEQRLVHVQRGLGLDVPAPTSSSKPREGYWPKTRAPHPAGSGWGFQGQPGDVDSSDD